MAKILLVSEATWHKTGYSNYGKNIVEGLLKKGHEVAELAAFGFSSDVNAANTPWKIYFCDPDQKNEEEVKLHSQSLQPNIASWKFELALLDFMPDYVISFRDPWVDRFIYESPLRKYFKWIYMPTCDGIPLDNNWVNAFQNADGLLTYSNWAFDEIKKFNKVNLIGCAPPAAEADIFKPMDTKQTKQMFGIKDDIYIIGTVMRNQERKLFPSLFENFREFLDQVPQEKRGKIKLLCHTSYPDVGWDLPRLLIEHNVEDNVYFTQICSDCKQIFVSKWSGPCRHCPMCNSDKVLFPSPSLGISREQLNLVYNAMDFYVQYASMEGFGMPQLEAAYCGIPLAATDYSAMSSVVREVGGYAIDVGGFYYEAATHRRIAVPNHKSFIDILNEVINMNPEEQMQKRSETRQLALQNFDYDKSVDMWEKAIKEIKPAKKWFDQINQQHYKIDSNFITHSDMLEDLYENIDDDLTWEKLDMLRSLNREFYDVTQSLNVSVKEGRFFPFTKPNLTNHLKQKIEKIIYWEQKRLNKIKGLSSQ